MPTYSTQMLQETRSQGGSGFAEVDVRVKVINPLISSGPSILARILSGSSTALTLRVPGAMFVGALIQVRMRGKVFFGEVRCCTPQGPEHEIGVQVKEIY